MTLKRPTDEEIMAALLKTLKPGHASSTETTPDALRAEGLEAAMKAVSLKGSDFDGAYKRYDKAKEERKKPKPAEETKWFTEELAKL